MLDPGKVHSVEQNKVARGQCFIGSRCKCFACAQNQVESLCRLIALSDRIDESKDRLVVYPIRPHGYHGEPSGIGWSSGWGKDKFVACFRRSTNSRCTT